MKAVEVNFDGLVGPTHNYAGLSYGNIASASNQSDVSSPRQAALQGLEKMKALHDQGFVQGFLLPHERPLISGLRHLGFSGSDTQVLNQVAKTDPVLLSTVSSASCMWTANAATISPSADTSDGKVHITPANLCSKYHRAIEAPMTGRLLKAIFSDENYFSHHPALPSVAAFGDEGAANHTRFCNVTGEKGYGEQGVEFFVYGQDSFDSSKPAPQKFPARQTLQACEALARYHQLSEEGLVMAQQNPEVVDAGVFHNDVIAVGNGNVLFFHEQAFINTESVLEDIRIKLLPTPFIAIKVSQQEVSVKDAVASYLFNSQLLTKPDGKMCLVVPSECQELSSVARYLKALVSDDSHPIDEIKVFDLKQSMKNGGGPACLRLRVVLTEEELAAVHSQNLFSENQYLKLKTWVEKHYRDRLSLKDLADPQLLVESHTALDELTQLLALGSIYDFQL